MQAVEIRSSCIWSLLVQFKFTQVVLSHAAFFPIATRWSISKTGLRIRILLDPCSFDLLDSGADPVVKTGRYFKETN